MRKIEIHYKLKISGNLHNPKNKLEKNAERLINLQNFKELKIYS